MIVNVTSEQIDAMFALADGVKEPVVIPWSEDGNLVALATGFIDVWPEFPGKTAYLDCMIVLTAAKRKLEVMNLFPDTIAQMMRERGDIERIALCIGSQDPRHDRLEKWALRRGYTKYGTTDSRDWYVLPLKENQG